MHAPDRDATRHGTPMEVLWAFLKLGLSAFGGPIAHLGYFREEFVVRRRWLDESGYADLVALCQFLPGPASSQVGFALGLLRAGPLGALAAWVGFTLPSAVLMVAIALGAAWTEGPLAQGVLHGLKLVAVAVVAQAVWGMARTLTPDRPRIAIALVAVLLLGVSGSSLMQLAVIVGGALAGLVLCRAVGGREGGALHFPISRAVGVGALVAFAVLLVVLPVAGGVFGSFYRAGALVFGGGHVVLPLLDGELVGTGLIGADAFLAGYGAAQAMPGPLFTFAAYLGALVGPGGVAGAALALIAIFLPGMLLVVGTLPFWNQLRGQALAQAGMAGANAAVVGILGAALYDPVFTGAVLSGLDFALALVGFVALVAWKCPPWVVVLGLAVAGGVLGVVF